MANILVITPAILIIFGAILGIRTFKHWSPWITLIGGLMVALSGAIRMGIGPTTVIMNPSDATVAAQFKWMDISSYIFMAGLCIIALGYLLEVLRGAKNNNGSNKAFQAIGDKSPQPER